MERSGNFYKAIRLGYILISILIGCMAYNSLYEWQEIEALELGNKKIDELLENPLETDPGIPLVIDPPILFFSSDTQMQAVGIKNRSSLHSA